ncbi:MAG: endonuclease/exonuclease/phosphatase family protein [Pseudomonadota bacterium]
MTKKALMMADMITCATWNIHRAKGGDGQIDPDRILTALSDGVLPHQPDILALQEADTDRPPHAGILNLDAVGQTFCLRSIHDADHLLWGPESHGFLGTILFVRPEFEVRHAAVLDLPGHCHRGAVVAELNLPAGRLRVISTHLSLSQPLRIVQMRIIGQYMARRGPMQTLMLGDFNEWRPWGGFAFSKMILGYQFAGCTRATFPASCPLLPLDRIISNAPGAVKKTEVIATHLTRIASDHLPLVSRVAVLRDPALD